MGLQKNFVYSSILTVSNYVFPLIIFPYIFRVLGVANVGICSFIDNIINYFVIFSMLGVSAIGIRETAASRTNKEQLNKVFSSLITLNGLFTVALLCILILCTQFIDKLNTELTVRNYDIQEAYEYIYYDQYINSNIIRKEISRNISKYKQKLYENNHSSDGGFSNSGGYSGGGFSGGGGNSW